MSDSNKLREEFSDREYREAYAEDFLNTWIATQVAAIREQRGLTQQELGELVGMHQEAISRVENVNYGRWNIGTLRKIAFALGTRLKVSLETFGSLIEEAEEFSREALQRPAFEEDPVFTQAQPESAPVPSRPAMDDQTPVGWMRAVLLPWLEAREWQERTLLDWLQGRNLPAFGHDEEPYHWILQTLPAEPQWRRYRTELASRVASLISSPEAWQQARRPDQFISNLLLLAAGLELPEQLAAPLHTVYRRLKAGELTLNPDLSDCLLAALTRNQADTSLEDVWFSLIETGSHPILPGNEYDGFAGILRLPPRPNIAAIGRALKLMEEHLYRLEDPSAKFQELLEEVSGLYSGWEELGNELLDEACDNNWQDWALAGWAFVFGPRVERDCREAPDGSAAAKARRGMVAAARQCAQALEEQRRRELLRPVLPQAS